LDLETDSEEAFIVTELVDGPDLVRWVERDGPRRGVELADLADRLRSALAAVHAAGVVHRDVTPGNVLVAERGPVLIDFGIALADDDARITRAGYVVGTPAYVAPELLEGALPSPATDWWGWAAVLAFVATGRAPFGDGAVDDVLERVRTQPPDLAGLDPVTAAALGAALDRRPEHRPGPWE